MFSAGYAIEPMPLETPEQWEVWWMQDNTTYYPEDFELVHYWAGDEVDWREDADEYRRIPSRNRVRRNALTATQKRLIADVIDLWGVNTLRAKWNAAAAHRGREWREQKDQVLSGPRVFKKAYPNAIKEVPLV